MSTLRLSERQKRRYKRKLPKIKIKSQVEIDREGFFQMDRKTCIKLGGNPELKTYCRDFYSSLLNKKLTIIGFLNNNNTAKVKYIDDSGEIKEKFVPIKCLKLSSVLEDTIEEEKPYFIMDNGAQFNNVSDFLDYIHLSEYKESLSEIMDLSLDEIKNIKDDDLLRYGITKPFHRQRFLRHARKMEPIPLFGGNKKKKRKSKKKLSRKRKYTKKNKLSKRR
tara:strand:+ start:2165 stop:2827 length:663 start_codon:yes stop_codon:yes gene_type:complete